MGRDNIRQLFETARQTAQPNEPLVADAGTILKTARVIGTPTRPADHGWLLREIAADPGEFSGLGVARIDRWCATEHQKRRPWLLFKASLRLPLLLRMRTTAKPFGLILDRWDRAQPNVLEVSCWCAAANRGQGLMTEALADFCTYAAERSACTLIMRMVPENEACIRLAIRCGFQLTGVVKNDFLDRAGRLHDSLIYARQLPMADRAGSRCGAARTGGQ